MTRRENLGDMARRAIKREWKVGDEVEFKHILELTSRLSERDGLMVGNIWNGLQSTGGKVKALETRVAEFESDRGKLHAIEGIESPVTKEEALGLLSDRVKVLETLVEALELAHGHGPMDEVPVVCSESDQGDGPT